MFIKVRALSCASLLALAAPATAVAATPPQAAQTRAFDIPAQSLSGALMSWGRQAGMQVAAPSELVRDRRSTAVRGALSPQDALTRLLQGSGLTSRVEGGTVRILAAAPATAAPQAAARAPLTESTLSDILVIGAGPSDGYRVNQSSTATRTNTPLRDVPQSIQIVSREVLQEQQAVRLTDALANVSGVLLNGTGGNRGETYNIRGFVTPRYAINGFQLTSAMDRPEAFFDLANVQQVEVLKGPSSVMFGLSEPGGVINIVTRAPTAAFEGDVAVQVGSHDFYRTEGSISGALNASRTLTGRLTGALQSDAGFRDAAAISERGFAAAALRWQPDDLTQIDFTLDHVDQSQPFDRGLIADNDGRVVEEAGRYLGEGWSITEARKTVAGIVAQRQMTPWLQLRATGRYSEALVADDNAVDLQGVEADNRTVRRRVTDRTEDSNDLNLRVDALFDVNTGPIEHKILAGVEYSDAQMDFHSGRANIGSIDLLEPVYGATPIPVTTTNNSYVYDVDMVSLFLQDQIRLTDQWKALFSLRHDSVETDEYDRLNDEHTRTDDSELTLRAGLIYQPNDWASFYGSYTESFQPQSGQTLDGSPLTPERGKQFELGAKLDLLDDRLSVTTAVFEITKQDVATEDPTDADFSILTGEQRVRGFEIDATGEIAEGWRVTANMALLDAEITRDNVFAVGNRLNGVPEYSGRVWTSRDFGPELRNLTLGAGVTVVGPREVDLDNRFEIDGYATLDATAQFDLTDTVEVSLHARNLTDEFHIEGVQGDNNLYPGSPRAFSVLVRTRF